MIDDLNSWNESENEVKSEAGSALTVGSAVCGVEEEVGEHSTRRG